MLVFKKIESFRLFGIWTYESATFYIFILILLKYFLFILKLIKVEQKSFKLFQLNDEAENILTNGSHEAVVFNSIPENGILQSDLMVKFFFRKKSFLNYI